jgi:hypothetical protein
MDENPYKAPKSASEALPPARRRSKPPRWDMLIAAGILLVPMVIALAVAVLAPVLRWMFKS